MTNFLQTTGLRTPAPAPTREQLASDWLNFRCTSIPAQPVRQEKSHR